MIKKSFFPQLALLAVSLIFGANYWITKNLMPVYLDPYQLLIIRTGGAFLLIIVVQFFSVKESVSTVDIFKIAFCSIFGIALNQGLLYIGLNKTSPFDASIIHTSNPIIVLLLSLLILKEKISLSKIAGILLGLTGALLLIITGKSSNESNLSSLSGNLFILANGIAYALYLILVKNIMEKYKPITVLKWLFFFGFIFSMPFLLLSNKSIIISNIGTLQWISIFYIIFINSFLAYLLIAYALKKVTATVAGYYTYIQPFIVAVIGVLIGKESPTLIKVFCGFLIFAGVYVINGNRRYYK
jgi:drug/metabolite transporter (DMT)-like permease